MSPLDQVGEGLDGLAPASSVDAAIRRIVALHGGVACAAVLSEQDDLFAAGLDSFGMVNVMLEIEEYFEIEFAPDMLNRRSFATILALRAVVVAAFGQND